MEIRELTYFAEVIDQGSITRAAGTIGISQPALTKCIKLLEERLGVQLLERSASGVKPTVYGETLYLRAKSISAELARAGSEIDELKGANAGTLSVGVLPTQATALLPLAAVRLTTARPGLRLHVVEKARDDLLFGLRRGDFDLIISVVEAETGPADLQQVVLVCDRPTAIIRKSHPANQLKQIRFRDLADYPWVLPAPDSRRRSHIERMFNEIGRPLPAGIIECHSISFMKAVVMQSDHVGVFPNDVLTREEAAGLLRSVKLSEMTSKRSIGALYRANYPLSDSARGLVRELRKIAAQWQTQ